MMIILLISNIPPAFHPSSPQIYTPLSLSPVLICWLVLSDDDEILALLQERVEEPSSYIR